MSIDDRLPLNASTREQPDRLPRMPANRHGNARALPGPLHGRLRLGADPSAPAARCRSCGPRAAFLKELRAALEGFDAARIEREARIPDAYIRTLREIGAFGMKIPLKYGGLGLSLLDYGRALMLVGSVSPSMGALLSAHQSIGVPEPVKMFGTEEQKQAFLPRCAAGAISAFLLTENDVGSDPARLGTTATLSEDGKSYTINGAKLWTTNGVVAELLVVMAAVPGHRLPDGSMARVASAPSWWRRIPPASPSRTATPSWACGASKTV